MRGGPRVEVQARLKADRDGITEARAVISLDMLMSVGVKLDGIGEYNKVLARANLGRDPHRRWIFGMGLGVALGPSRASSGQTSASRRKSQGGVAVRWTRWTQRTWAPVRAAPADIEPRSAVA